MSDKAEEYCKRCEVAVAGIVSGVEQTHAWRDGSLEKKWITIRVDVDTMFATVRALGKLLIDSGVISQDNYARVLCESMEAEKEKYEKLLSEQHNREVKL